MWQDVQKLIIDNEIFSIDIRFIGVDGQWQNITLPATAAVNLEDINKVCKKLKLQPLQENEIRHFIDPFLAHHTLVLLTDLLAGSSTSYDNLKASENVEAINYSLNFYFEPTNIQETSTNFQTDLLPKDAEPLPQENLSRSMELLAPSEDIWRDIRTEIVLAIEQMGVSVLEHYANYITLNKHNQKNYQNIITIASNTNQVGIQADSIQKVKYAILMVAKAYNILVNQHQGVFVDFNKPYENILKLQGKK